MAPRLSLEPPLLNAACPWASDLSFLRPLYASPSTGAITTRTSLVDGYPHDDAKNTFLFYDPSNSSSSTGVAPQSFPSQQPLGNSGSLNCFGLSPHVLATYLDWVRTLAAEFPNSSKPIIVSVTGETPESNADAVRRVIALASEVHTPLAVEINLSCPNVPGHPPPAYDASELAAYLGALPANPPIPVGLKTPPYTSPSQFTMLVNAVAAAQPKISFLTGTNTLGNCVVLDSAGAAILPSDGGFGGLAGPAIHPLSLGNVVTLRKLLNEAGLADTVDIIGVGGVSDAMGYKRMRAAGAKAVAVATALGKQGVAVFDTILKPTAKL
ncbi:dihydroorotate dehydrogenase [Apiotrichum porosum]|uniref:Dihydroorotate dehydrogenase n=1 Tax=Apiotrichum porosum TaxID=105984 RepID=A0A427Y6W3_9TREE|nr:dihydroorotate dehydrogenase [Apiotrichum porosum]RSH86804.1 dihydroorotate dehydrogenase [Apiotrichum porosum]